MCGVAALATGRLSPVYGRLTYAAQTAHRTNQARCTAQAKTPPTLHPTTTTGHEPQPNSRPQNLPQTPSPTT